MYLIEYVPKYEILIKIQLMKSKNVIDTNQPQHFFFNPTQTVKYSYNAL